LRPAAYATRRGAVAEAGHDLCGCAVLVGTGMPDWSTDEILAVHVRMHKAEGELFRDVLVAGARACGLELTTLPTSRRWMTPQRSSSDSCAP